MPKTKTRKIARPVKFQLCLTPEEKNKLIEISDQKDLTVSELIRTATLKRKLPQKVTEVAHKTYWELGKIGVNINQIARAANTALLNGQELPAIDLEELNRLEQLIKQVRKEISGTSLVDSEAS